MQEGGQAQAAPGDVTILFPAMFPTLATILITPAINNTPIYTNTVTVVKTHHGNHTMNDNIHKNMNLTMGLNQRCDLF